MLFRSIGDQALDAAFVRTVLEIAVFPGFRGRRCRRPGLLRANARKQAGAAPERHRKNEKENDEDAFRHRSLKSVFSFLRFRQEAFCGNQGENGTCGNNGSHGISLPCLRLIRYFRVFRFFPPDSLMEDSDGAEI